MKLQAYSTYYIPTQKQKFGIISWELTQRDVQKVLQTSGNLYDVGLRA